MQHSLHNITIISPSAEKSLSQQIFLLLQFNISMLVSKEQMCL